MDYIDAIKDGSVLSLLDEARIFSVTPTKDGLIFKESCDEYYKCTLTFAAVRQMYGELEDLIDAIEDQHTALAQPDTTAE